VCSQFLEDLGKGVSGDMKLPFIKIAEGGYSDTVAALFQAFTPLLYKGFGKLGGCLACRKVIERVEDDGIGSELTSQPLDILDKFGQYLSTPFDIFSLHLIKHNDCLFTGGLHILVGCLGQHLLKRLEPEGRGIEEEEFHGNLSELLESRELTQFLLYYH
jgi:hypothetical protein